MIISRMSVFIKSLLAFSLVCVGAACDRDVPPIKSGYLPDANPVWYVFPAPAEEVKAKVLDALESERKRDLYEALGSEGPLGLNNPFSFAVEDRETARWSERLFENPDNRNDIYLFSDGREIAPSKMYFGDGKPLMYTANFQLHISPLDKNSTVVTVVTHDSRVYNGLKCCGPHGRYANSEPVQPSTVEEYTILLFVGSVLGQTNMPPLRLPGPPGR